MIWQPLYSTHLSFSAKTWLEIATLRCNNRLQGRCRYFLQRESYLAEYTFQHGLVRILRKGICSLKDKDYSLSTDQRVDAFKHALGNILRDLVGLSDGTLPPGLPTPVKPVVSAPEKGTTDLEHSQAEGTWDYGNGRCNTFTYAKGSGSGHFLGGETSRCAKGKPPFRFPLVDLLISNSNFIFNRMQPAQFGETRG